MDRSTIFSSMHQSFTPAAMEVGREAYNNNLKETFSFSLNDLVHMQNIIRATCTVRCSVNPTELQAGFTSKIQQTAAAIRHK